MSVSIFGSISSVIFSFTEHLYFFSILQNVNWTPSKMIRLMGEMIDNEESIYYWAFKVHFLLFVDLIRSCCLHFAIFNSQ